MAAIQPQDLARALLDSDAGGMSLASLEKTQTGWRTLAGAMQSRLDGTGDPNNPGLLDHVLALQDPGRGATWSGAAADSFLNNIKSVWTFGYDVRGQLQQTPWSSTDAPTASWADAVGTLQSALQTAQGRYREVNSSYQSWIADMATNLGNFVGTSDELNPNGKTVPPGRNGAPGYTMMWGGLAYPDNYYIRTTEGETLYGSKGDLTNPATLAENFKSPTYYQPMFDDILANLSATYDTVRRQLPTPVSTKALPKADPGNPAQQQLPADPATALAGTPGLSPGAGTAGLGPAGLSNRTAPGANTPGVHTPGLTTRAANTPGLSSPGAPPDTRSTLPSAPSGAQPALTSGLPAANTAGVVGADPATSLAGFKPGSLDSGSLGLTPATGAAANTPGLSGLPGLGLSPAATAGPVLGGPVLGGPVPAAAGPGGSTPDGSVLGVAAPGALGLSGAGVDTPGAGAPAGRGTLGGAAEEVGGGTGAPSAGAQGAATLAGEAAAAEGAAATGGRMPYMPPMSPMGMGNTGQDRPRKAWLPDDEDVWGVRTSAVPGVLNGD